MNGVDVLPNLPDRDYAEAFGVRTLAQGGAFVKSVPEPGTWAMLAAGLVGVATAARLRPR